MGELNQMLKKYLKIKNKNMPEKNNLTKNLKQLSEIADWFENREDVDVEEGLKKVKQAAVIIKESKKRLKEIENEFQEVKKELDEE